MDSHQSVPNISLRQSAPLYSSAQIDQSEQERILIVDDSATVRHSFVRLLRDRYECYEASDVPGALELLRTTPIDLVITDVLMPGLSGVELLRMVMERYPETAVIVVSGVDRPQRALDAVRLGAFDYLIKPCDEEVLELTVVRALERRRLLINAVRYKADLEAQNLELAEGKAKLERLQAQIIHSEKMASLGQLSAGIAHEINNPVGFITGNLDILQDSINAILKVLELYDTFDLSAVEASAVANLKRDVCYLGLVGDMNEVIADCQTGAERVKDIVQNLKTFSRLDEAEFKPTDIHEGIDSTIRLLSRYFSGGKVNLVRDYGPIPEVNAYSSQLNQVWMNLLVNAAQAIGGEHGEVRVATTATTDSVTVSVSDTGAGIDPTELNKIFDPFFTTKPVGEGSGLGLSIVFGIVDRHKGRIDVTSEPGKGTTFRVILPIKISDRKSAANDDEGQILEL